MIEKRQFLTGYLDRLHVYQHVLAPELEHDIFRVTSSDMINKGVVEEGGGVLEGRVEEGGGC